MKTEKYTNAEKYLQSSGKFRITLGLERIFAILDILGNPQDKMKVIHIAGTNGKGSVSVLTAEILSEAGFKTALYTSPHLFKYNERFKINGIDISDEDFSNYVFQIENLAKKNDIDLSEFEILTAAAYKYFADNQVDFAVMETGLGGRFDAVNAVEKPFVTAITSISIDHKDRLGDTIEKIAFEKAGIIKNSVPVVVNTHNLGFDVIEKIASERNARLLFADKNVEISFENGVNYAIFDGEKFEFALWGFHQKQNLSLVLKIVDFIRSCSFEITNENIKSALKKAFIPARFQYDKTLNRIVDGSHNADAAFMLRKNLDFYFPDKKRVWIYGTLSTKEYEKVVNILFREGDTVYLVDFDNKLSVPSEEILSKIHKKNDIFIKIFSKTANTLNFSSNESLTIVTGSFYMIGELLG